MRSWWSPLEKLRWHAAVARVDTDGRASITIEPDSENGYYTIATRASVTRLDYAAARAYINGYQVALEESVPKSRSELI